ncbi:PHP domain-containing protein [Methylocystis sp. H62]|uniref:PHP domain-containing protein n=1 Tax=Methylocystis sp. H62 TaxID=2785789 RepID=UPI0018C1D93A|nr:PHP domain-containing protein [Methylocystis sp. H62]MBG0792351.1 PHP domain-containing protein [Methylocystis sp. H62]
MSIRNGSDGNASVAEMAQAAKARGYAYMALTDHSRRVTIAHGLARLPLLRQIDEIDRLNAKLRPFTVLKGIEVDILADGSLDLPDEVLSAARHRCRRGSLQIRLVARRANGAHHPGDGQSACIDLGPSNRSLDRRTRAL